MAFVQNNLGGGHGQRAEEVSPVLVDAERSMMSRVLAAGPSLNMPVLPLGWMTRVKVLPSWLVAWQIGCRY